MQKRPIYYDTETTGINPEKDRIIEIAAYDPIENRTFIQLINPQIPIPPECIAISNITDEMVKDAPLFDEVGKAFLQFCPPNSVLIAHNNDKFDKLFVEAECRRAELSLPKWEYIDTLKWSRRYRPDLPRHSLQHLREVYAVAANQAHRALDDVMVLYQVFSQMIDNLSIETILQLLSETKEMNRMPFGKHQGKPLDQIPREYVVWLRDTGAFEKPQNKELRESFERLGII